MKKIIYSLLAVTITLFAASCSENDMLPNVSENEAQVTFTLELPESGLQTRAIGDGEQAKQLVYEVFDASGEPVMVFGGEGDKKSQKEETVVSYPHSITLTLAKGQEYQIAFWAQNSSCEAYGTEDLRKVTIDYTGVNNNEERDAFFTTVKHTVMGNALLDVTLNRPFAQLNVGVNQADWDAAAIAGLAVTKSKVTIVNVADRINLLNGNVSTSTTEPVVVEYALNTIPTETLNVDINGTPGVYKYLSMSYFLSNDETGGDAKTTLESVSFDFQDDNNKSVLLENVTNVPVQRNYRTNILGNLLTADVDFKISIDPIFETPDNNLVAVEDRVKLSYFTINDNVTSFGKISTENPSMLGYYVHVNVAGSGAEKLKVEDTESIVVKFLGTNDAILGSISLNEHGYSNNGATSGLGGTINVYGDYVSSSWDAKYFGSWDKNSVKYDISEIAKKAVAIVKYKNGEFSETTQIGFLNPAKTGTHHTDVKAFEHILRTLQLYVNEGSGWIFHVATNKGLTIKGDIDELSLKLSDGNGKHIVTRKLRPTAGISASAQTVSISNPYVGSSWELDIESGVNLDNLIYVDPSATIKVVNEIPTDYKLQATVKYKNGVIVTKSTNRFRTINAKTYWEADDNKTIIIEMPDGVTLVDVENIKNWRDVSFETIVGNKAKITLTNGQAFGSVQYKVVLKKGEVKYEIVVAPTSHIKTEANATKLLFMEVK